MNTDELMKLRQFYHSFLGQQRIFDNIKGPQVNDISIRPLVDELRQLNNEFPSLVSTFNKRDYYLFTSSEDIPIYNLTSIRAYIAMVIGRLEIVIEQPSDIPVTEKRQFTFIYDKDLRTIIERDYSEIQRAYISECWKSVIILCGGTIEAILTDLLTSNEPATKVAKSAPKEPDITRWDLSNLIDVAAELSLVSAGVEKLSHPIREYRNLVHPGYELRNKLRFDAEEAKIAVEVLNIVHRDLSN